MYSKFVKAAAFAIALAFTQAPAFAGQQDFSIVNKTGYPIKHVYVSEANNNDWEEDILGRDMLNNGESFDLAFGKADKTCKWDMKVVYDDGDSATWEGLNLCQISRLTLRWNKNSGVTSATVE